MITIRLLDARRGLHRKCEELFGDTKIAEAIYRFLCDGIEECEDAEPERKEGKWRLNKKGNWACPFCEFDPYHDNMRGMNYCPNCGARLNMPLAGCGAKMEEEDG